MSIPASHRGKMTVNIEMDNSEIVRVLAHLGLVSVIFFYTTCSLGEIIRRSLKMTKGGPYFDPYSKDFKSLSVLLYGICHCKYCREPIPKDIWNQASSADPHLSWYLQAWIIEKPCWDCVVSLSFTLIGLCAGHAGTVSCRVATIHTDRTVLELCC
uniref:Uncharacterized protein n=1 Tax=Timema monikensis TaxID=170555 RepID=A0A7R9HUR4_9NEOP|nr:unnamed protein product [Timema monikensis]